MFVFGYYFIMNTSNKDIVTPKVFDKLLDKTFSTPASENAKTIQTQSKWIEMLESTVMFILFMLM